MGQQGLCQKRALSGAPFDDCADSSPPCRPSIYQDGFARAMRSDMDIPTDEDRALAISMCQRCILAYSRVAPEVIRNAQTVGELRCYVKEMQARECMLNGYDGQDDREQEGLTGGAIR
uniref:Uncharacterized protein n=1 Tax=Lessardia elongata TaxID=210733 RepID=A0A7S2VWS2_9DINO|mmetsp:Transcript_1494/g.1084  ORF Transcript_1494/g.1084 Transcript_1494/m.1084 type:complete len:118 (+) Transcript_1494:79-432(+)